MINEFAIKFWSKVIGEVIIFYNGTDAEVRRLKDEISGIVLYEAHPEGDLNVISE